MGEQPKYYTVILEYGFNAKTDQNYYLEKVTVFAWEDPSYFLLDVICGVEKGVEDGRVQN